MPFLFEHFFSTRSILSSSMVLRQIVRIRAHNSYRRDEPLKRIQNIPQTSWQIFLAQIILFAQIDNDLPDSGEFVHHYFALLLILLHFLMAQSLDDCLREYMEYIPHGERLKQETRDGGDEWVLACQGAPRLENGERCLNRVHRSVIMSIDFPSWVRDDCGSTWAKTISQL
jgi:hypothetical protein